MAERTLSRRALGRTLLARQHLLERVPSSVTAMATHLVGLQAQVPRNPYLALWSRLDGFDPLELERAFLDRDVVRIVLMRGTIHLVTADDALGLRPLFTPVLEQELVRHAQYAPLLRDVDLRPVLAHARTFLTEPRSTGALREELATRFPDHDPAALAYACRNHLALVQTPPRGLWTASGQVTYATADAWLHGRTPPPLTIDDAVLRYLRAFGPATAADLATWTRLTGFREVVERLRPQLRTFRDEAGHELLDVHEAVLSEEDVPAPVRFLPEYDNVLLSHADRSRVIEPDLLPGLYDARGAKGSVLVDGLLQATWRLDRARVVVTHQPKLARAARAEVEAEARRSIALLAPGASDPVVELRPAPTGAENAEGPE